MLRCVLTTVSAILTPLCTFAKFNIGPYRYPDTINDGYIVELVWKGVSYDRMQAALKTFAVEDRSVSGYLYHRLLGHPVPEQMLECDPNMDFRVPNLPGLNDSQQVRFDGYSSITYLSSMDIAPHCGTYNNPNIYRTLPSYS